MCEQTSVSYNPGDVVWVKLGPCWWPGEVVSLEELPSDITESFKKPPLTVVKFFDEEKYEFVKQLTHIHLYNSSRKYDFIKKGMDLFRAKHSFMEKFPVDVCSAERKTDGNPNILDDPRVVPGKKPNYSSIFGSPFNKKGTKESPRGRGRSSTGKLQSPSSPKKTSSLITHPRFLGNDDSQIKILVQTPSVPTIPETEYQCNACDFKANRIDVIILHNASHLRRASQVSSPKKTKSSPAKKSKKRRLPKSKTQTIEEDLALLRQGLPLCSDQSSDSSATENDESDDEPLIKKKPTPKSPSKPKKQKINPVPEIKKQTDIRTDLLAEWDDDEDEDEPVTNDPETTISEPDDSKNEFKIEPPKIEEKNKSCFDFDEDEEDLVTALEGRRLPRVIPPTDKRKSSIHELEKQISTKSRSPSPISEIPESNLEATKPNSERENENNENDATKKKDSQFQLEFEAFNNSLKELTVPDIPPLLKFEQNFHSANTIKFPDKTNIESEPLETSSSTQPVDALKVEEKRKDDTKNEENTQECLTEIISTINIKEPVIKSTEIATKLTNPKKRFVKTFEDETKNSTAKESTIQEEKKEPSPEPQKSEAKELEVAKLKTQLMKKLGDGSPKKENTKQIEKSKKNLPKRKLKVTVDVTKIQLSEDKNNKRSVSDSKSDYATRTHVKRKRYSAGYKESVKESIVDSQTDTLEPTKDDVKDKKEQSTEANRATLETLSSSTSSLLTEFNVDDDELLNANVLSDNQKLTIQNIIGVNSPILPTPSSTAEKSNTDSSIKSYEETEKTDNTIKSYEETEKESDLTSLNEAAKPDAEETEKNETNMEDKSKNKEEIVDKTPSVELEQPITEIEENIDHITHNQICELTDKLSTKISENLPDEIIEKTNEKIVENQNEDIIEEPEDKIPQNLAEKINSVIEQEIREPIEEEIRKPIEDPIKKVSEEKFEKFLEAKFEELGQKKDLTVEKNPEKIEPEEVLKKEVQIPVDEIEKDTLNVDQQSTIVNAVSEGVQTPAEVQSEDENRSLVDLKTFEEGEKQNENIDALSADIFEKQVEDVKDESVATEFNNKKEIEVSVETLGKNKNDLVKSLFSEEEMVNIEGNLTVVSERDLADKQVEITTTPEVSKPITLSSFSMDFCEDVESYIKGDDIMRKFPKSNRISPVTIKEKTETTDDTQKEILSQQTKLDSTTNVQEKEKKDLLQIDDKPEDQINKTERPEQKEPEKENLSDDQNNIQVDAIDDEDSKTKMSDDVIKQTKDNATKIVTNESFSEPLIKENESTENINSNLQNLLEEFTEEKKIEVVTTKTEDESKLVKEQSIPEVTEEIIQEEEVIIPPMDISVESEVAKITDSLIEQEVVIQDSHQNTSSTKLLEILTDKPKSSNAKPSPVLTLSTQPEETTITTGKQTYKHAKFATKASASRITKATILENKLIKPLDESKTVSVKKVTSKRTYQDVEDIDTYIIQKPPKKLNVSIESESTPKMIKKPVIARGKARILQQTIITPTGDILQPPVSQPQSDDNMFDINSMPIVLSDQILTPESIESMQIVLQENTAAKPQITPIKKPQLTTTSQQIKLLNKNQSPANMSMKETILKNSSPPKSYISNKQRPQKVYPSSSPKILKSNTSVITQPGKQGKFIIVPACSTPTGTKYTVGKRQPILKKPPPKIITPINKVPDVPITSSGNKIMILKGQGQQQKLLLTAPQKPTPTKFKGRPLGQKQIFTKESPPSKGANIISQTIVNSKGQITTLPSQGISGNRGQIIATMAQQSRSIKIDPAKMKRFPQQRLYVQGEVAKPSTSGQQRTIIIKNPQGQTVKKIQGTDDALLDQQVAEQLQAISRASATQHLKELSPKTTSKFPLKKPYVKKQEFIKPPAATKTVLHTAQPSNKGVSIPPLAPISPVKKVETQFTEPTELVVAEEKHEEVKRPPHQLVIQDAQGNQTTITEGQILALPSEAIDGQPHSYVLVTLDETGNLTPLNSEALMSLDPNLNLSSDLSNMVLQIDQGATTEDDTKTSQTVVQEQVETQPSQPVPPKETVENPPVENVLVPEPPAPVEPDQNVQVINSADMGQLIITGDAATAQKFLESLAEGNPDLANILANAEGNVLIQADGQQILINTDSENPMLVMNPENMSNENTEGSGNPIFASQPVKNQDILAAALADTDVFQPDQSISHSPSKIVQSQLSPNSTLYPMNVSNVLETNSMSSPIMTPLEVPSTNSKKINDESEILSQVPKNVDLPITITDPTITQTVAQQQLMAAELPPNLDLPLAIQDPGMSATSAEMSSPSFVYSLPTLDDTVDINQKAFSGSISMPLLTEEPEDSVAESSNSSEALVKDIIECHEKKNSSDDDKKSPKPESSETNLESVDKNIESDKKTDFIESEGLCAIRGGICNSLSEPPPDMFDFSVETQSYKTPDMTQTIDMDIPMDTTSASEISNTINDQEGSVSSVEERKTDDGALYTVNSTSPSTNTDDSCEIPLQPLIVAKPFEENGTGDSRFDGEKVPTDGDV